MYGKKVCILRSRNRPHRSRVFESETKEKKEYKQIVFYSNAFALFIFVVFAVRLLYTEAAWRHFFSMSFEMALHCLESFISFTIFSSYASSTCSGVVVFCVFFFFFTFFIWTNVNILLDFWFLFLFRMPVVWKASDPQTPYHPIQRRWNDVNENKAPNG